MRGLIFYQKWQNLSLIDIVCLPDIGQYIVLSGFSTLDTSACGVSIGIQKDGNAPFVETPLVTLDDPFDSLCGVMDDEDDPRMGVTELAAALSASVIVLVSFLYLL